LTKQDVLMKRSAI